MASRNASAVSDPISAKQYQRVLLTRFGKPMNSENFMPGQAYIFHYPYVTTPCLIFNLGEPAKQSNSLLTEKGNHYTWQGGFGPDRSIVSYSAICAHRMTYPAKNASFLNYRHQKVSFINEMNQRQEKEKIIYCCSERSVYDAAKGAEVLGGPAPQPLASIVMEYDSQEDSYYAIGTTGGEMFEDFLTTFEFRLQLDFEVVNVRELSEGKVELLTIEEFSDVVVNC